VPWTLLLRPTVILGILLMLSVGGNVILFKARDRALKEVGAVTAELENARAAGKACSDATAALRKAADAQEKKARAALAAAEKAEREAELRAQATLQTPPSVNGDSCASVDVLNQQKLKERRGGK